MINKNKNKIIKIISFLAFIIFCAVFFRAIYYIPSDEIPLSKDVLEKITIENPETTATKNDLLKYPTRLIIPKIAVDANVQKVGITKKGNMATPNNFIDVGWYKYGTIPGEKGSAVLAGHVDDGLSLPGVFSRLNELQKGNDIYLMTENNEQLHFVVVKSTIYDFDASASKVFTENDEKFLKLITCTGDWLKQYNTHSQRLVISAVLVET